MQRLEIKGGKKISGVIKISGSKNATLPILASTILTNKKGKVFKRTKETSFKIKRKFNEKKGKKRFL